MKELLKIDINGNECRFQYRFEHGDVFNRDEVTFKAVLADGGGFLID